MKSVDIGVLSKSICFSFIPSELAQKLYFYPTWCGHYYCTKNYYMKRDSFPPLLVVYIREGMLHFECHNKCFDAKKGDVVLLDCSKPHYYQAYDGLEFVYMHFDGSNSHDICSHILSQNGPLFRSENMLMVGNLLYNMTDFYQHDGIETMFQSSMRIYHIFEYLLDVKKQQYEKDNPIDNAIRYIRSNIGKDISLEDLANIANLSVYYFAHCFKEQTGFSPMEFVISTRINQAKVLLVNTSKSISEIAYEIGYSSVNGLNNIFTKKEGMTPGQYRRNYAPSELKSF